MTSPLSPRRLVPALAAVAGVVVAHVVDYVLLFPGGAHRSGHLAATGHGYWPVAVASAVAAAAVTAMLVAARGALQPYVDGRELEIRWRDLVAWQTGAFVVMEIAERAGAGVPLDLLGRAPELWFGLLLQVPVAWLVARMLRVLGRVASKLAARERPAWSRSAAGALLPQARSLVSVRLHLSPAGPRAPPTPRLT